MTPKEIQALADKIPVYKAELDSLIKQVTQKRTELATLAKTTIESLEERIPVLQEQVKNLYGQIGQQKATLDSLKDEIDDLNRNGRIDYESQCLSYKKHTDALADDLKAQISKQKSENAKFNAQYRETLKRLKIELETAETRKEAYEAKLNEIEAREANCEKIKAILDKDRSVFLRDAAKQAEKDKETVKALAKKAADLTKREKDIDKKQASLEADLDCVAKIDAREACLNKREMDLSAMQAEANRKEIRALSIERRASQKTALLEKKEKDLLQREQAIKDIEKDLMEKR